MNVLRFGPYASDWLAGRTLKPRTRALYQSQLDRLVLPTFANVPIEEITPRTVRAWHTRLGDGTPTQRAHAYSLLRTILNDAVADELIAANPCRIRGAGSSKRVKTIKPATLAEIATIVEAVPDKYRLLILLAAWCGPRFGELTELRRSDVEFTRTVKGSAQPDGAILHITRAVSRVNGAMVVGTPKSDAGIRDVNVPPHLVPTLVDHMTRFTAPGSDALLFTAASDGVSHLPSGSVDKVFQRARAEAGRPDLRFHDLRHTGAVLAAVSGATLAELMNRIGHSTVGAALRYQHVGENRDAALAIALSKLATDAEVVPIRSTGS